MLRMHTGDLQEGDTPLARLLYQKTILYTGVVSPDVDDSYRLCILSSLVEQSSQLSDRLVQGKVAVFNR